MEVKSGGGARMAWADSGEGSSIKRPDLEEDQCWRGSPKMIPRGSALADVMSPKREPTHPWPHMGLVSSLLDSVLLLKFLETMVVH